ncbi:WD40 repeat domain-containing protein [Nonomuraea sp. NPDC050663]|uniref:WD40 repeat domain-containing protein n=1 Tax=Nonomuraea sp. NPDC050663 TaxID=3364370 RepID=UPI0037BD98E9
MTLSMFLAPAWWDPKNRTMILDPGTIVCGLLSVDEGVLSFSAEDEDGDTVVLFAYAVEDLTVTWLDMRSAGDLHTPGGTHRVYLGPPTGGVPGLSQSQLDTLAGYAQQLADLVDQYSLISEDSADMGDSAEVTNLASWAGLAGDMVQMVGAVTDLVRIRRRFRALKLRLADPNERARPVFGETALRFVYAHESGYCTRAAFSPDGTRIAVGCSDGTIRFVDPMDGRDLGQLNAEGDDLVIEDVAYSPEGDLLLTAVSDGTARIWNLGTGEEILQLPHGDTIDRAFYSPDAFLILTFDCSLTVKLWLAETGEFLGDADDDEVSKATCAAFHPAADRLALGSFGRFSIEDLDGQHSRSEVECDDDVVQAVAFHPGGWLGVGGDSGWIRLYDVDSDNRLLLEIDSGSDVGHLCFSPNHAWLAASGQDQVTIWDGATGALLADLSREGQAATVWATCWSPDSRILAVADTTLRVYSIQN